VRSDACALELENGAEGAVEHVDLRRAIGLAERMVLPLQTTRERERRSAHLNAETTVVADVGDVVEVAHGRADPGARHEPGHLGLDQRGHQEEGEHANKRDTSHDSEFLKMETDDYPTLESCHRRCRDSKNKRLRSDTPAPRGAAPKGSGDQRKIHPAPRMSAR